MRPPSTPEIGENAVTSATNHTPSPEFRTRIESDVRFYLRQPSSPWITFDRDGNAPILQSAHSSILPSQGVFPVAPYQAAPPAVPAPESSNMVVAADVGATTGETPFATSPRVPRKAVGIVALTFAAALTVGIGARATAPDAPVAAPRQVAVSPPPATVQADPPPPDLAAAATVAPAPEKKGFGKLSLRGAARSKRVYMDGKLLLGSGSRSFMVYCGTHSIAIGNKDDARDVEVPCNGELVIGR